ncbi:diphthamide biosynthesis protein [Stereum hirsutum FP-91666 SS1]|uniref:diphthamide biosynthesis protein n=1 Tax=Stereum hirsutum (strain FP-91666) TaxID=721885 RepID=UPI0004449F5C|nr:diphthamide biosynthesis protein [Stereum hirsutum FP-91666 SS1]EIM84817.1 diphthamide biosynthesis protein [Stereum hirsutum FP-91666 SS1]
MAENTAFSSSGQDIISRPVELDEGELQLTQNLTKAQLAEFYDIDRIVDEILSNHFKRVALQFPDELLHDSVPIYRMLKRRIEDKTELYVLADTSYGSCCADEVAAQHVDADAIVHFGHACMSKTYRIPVLYVFGKKKIDVQDCAHKLVESLRSSCSSSDIGPSSIILRHDVAYTHAAANVLQTLQETLTVDNISVSYNQIPHRLDPSPSTSTSHSPLEESSDSRPILYVGPPSLGLTNLLMTHHQTPVYSYDPSTRQVGLESTRTNKLLMRRYVAVQKARDADVFGILVGTLGVSSYLPLITHLRQLLKKARKKSYTISVGKLNPAKLANFMEVECFVLVACPENSMIEAKEFLQPIVTPYELQIALQPEPTWTGEYVLDFDKILSDSIRHTDGTESATISDATNDTESQEDIDPDQPTFSLMTGKYRHAKRYGDAEETPTPAQIDEDHTPTSVILRNHDNAVATLKDSAAGEFLQARSFRGLETRTGLDAPSILEQGRSGIPKNYADDH